jgi:hypothetical protein
MDVLLLSKIATPADGNDRIVVHKLRLHVLRKAGEMFGVYFA